MKAKTKTSFYESPLVLVGEFKAECGVGPSGVNWSDRTGAPSGSDVYDDSDNY